MLVAACPALEETDAAEPEDLVTTNFAAVSSNISNKLWQE